MPYLLCLVSQESYEAPIFRNGYYSWDSSLYAAKPNLKNSKSPINLSGIEVIVLPLILKDNLVDIEYSDLYAKHYRYKCNPGFNNDPEVLYCIKVNSFDSKNLDSPFILNIQSPKEIIGCISFSSPRIIDGISYCTSHDLAEKLDRDAFIASVQKRYEKGNFVRTLIKHENVSFNLPESLMKPKEEPKVVIPTIVDNPPPNQSGIFSFFSNLFPKATNTVNKELDELFLRAKENPELAAYLLSQAKEFEKKAGQRPQK